MAKYVSLIGGLLLVCFAGAVVLLGTHWPVQKRNGSIHLDDEIYSWDDSLGFRYGIALNSDRSQILRSILVYLPAESFTKQNVESLFTKLTRDYPYPQDLIARVYSNREMVSRSLRLSRSEIRDLIFPETEEGRRLRQQWEEKYQPASKGYFRAIYSRAQGVEKFSYSPDPNSEEMVTVVLKDKTIVYTGDSDTDLILAAREGDAAKIEALLGGATNIETRDKSGNTALMLAVLMRHDRVVKTLLTKAADVNSKDKQGSTSLMYAAANADPDMIRELLSRGARVNEHNLELKTPLLLAVFHRDLESVRLLVSVGANLEVKNGDGDTALLIAVKNRNLEIVRLLVENGADVNATNNYLVTPLTYSRNDRELLDVLRLRRRR